MKPNSVIIICASLLAGTALADTENFDKATGSAPAGWTTTKTGGGSPKWTVENDDTAPSKPNVLKQSGEATYPVCIKDDTKLKDGYVEVKFKSVAGRKDQAGGVVWRYLDENNYYVARANALEDNVTIYHTINGNRVSFKSASVTVKPGIWHTLRVDFHGSHFIVIFNGTKVIEADDTSLSKPGKIGVWTKADSITLFDDFSYGQR